MYSAIQDIDAYIATLEKSDILHDLESIDLSEYKGEIPVNMCNDRLFHLLMSINKKVAKSFVCSLLHLDVDAVTDIHFLDPELLKKSLIEKKYVLDLLIELGDGTRLNIEMQVMNESDWSKRAVLYLSRLYDNMLSGQNYSTAKPAYQIGILDFTPFKENRQFYSSYCLMDMKTSFIFNSDFQIKTLDLCSIDQATDEDRKYGLDKWAYFFKSKTWEELQVMATSDSDIKSAAQTTAYLIKDPACKLTLMSRDEELAHLRDVFAESRQNKEENTVLKTKLNAVEKENTKLGKENTKLGKKIDELQAYILANGLNLPS